MSNIINKSNHPVEIKRVELQIWRLRDEIETAIAHRIGNASDPQDVKIDDIKSFYLKSLSADGTTIESDEQTAHNDSASEEESAAVDSSGNPLDDDAMAMMAALDGGGDDTEEEAETEEASESPEEESTEESTEASEEEADDDAAALAAAMLADQGIGAPSEDQTETSDEVADEVQNTAPFRRMMPTEDKIVEGFVFLSDIQMDQIMLFAKNNFIHGQNIVIKFLVPKPFSITAEVIASTNIARNSRIISLAKPEFRLQCVFKCKFPGERGNLRDFLQSIEPDIPEPPKKLRRPDDDDDDDFDDLGF